MFFLVSLSLAGCYHEDSHSMSGGGEIDFCSTGVSFDLSAMTDTIDREGVVNIRACFDKSCDELTLSSSGSGRSCGGPPGGPPDQLTGCSLRGSRLSVDILRVDDQDYADGRSHTAAISLKNSRGDLLAAHAEAVDFGSGGCGIKTLKVPADQR